MIESINSRYDIPEDLMDGVLIHQKDRMIKWLNEMETTTDTVKFTNTYNKVMGAVIVLANLWSLFGYSYKAEELTKRITKMRTSHKLRELMK